MLMCLLAVPFFFFLYIDALSTSLYRYKANVSPCSTVFFFSFYT